MPVVSVCAAAADATAQNNNIVVIAFIISVFEL
jgi:hypothetical protein